MIRLLSGFVVAFALSASVAGAQDAAPDGKALFATKTCVACHGRGGARAIMMYPDLAGQGAAYMLAQINAIADGSRVAGPDPRGYPRTQGMKDIMHLVNAKERQAIADYLSKEPSPKLRPLTPPIDDARLAAGKEAFTKGGCQSCHGVAGQKPLAGYPIIAGMKRDYLQLQLTEIRDGLRTGGRVKSMQPFAKKLDDQKIAQIADYLSQTERAPK